MTDQLLEERDVYITRTQDAMREIMRVVNPLEEDCKCPNLADPNDDSRYAGYAEGLGTVGIVRQRSS
jgi:hypothetical protein